MVESRPLVSVVLPTYNRVGTLRRAVTTVLEQSYEHIELIIVDDCSTDDTRRTVEEWSDDRIRYIRLEQRSGAPVARNVGSLAARGSFVAFQDSDDEWCLTKIALQVARFVELPAAWGVVYTPLIKLTSAGRLRLPGLEDDRPRHGDLSTALLRSNFISTQTAMVRPEALRDVGGFDVDLPRFQDWDLWLRISRRYLIDCVDEELVTAYDSGDSISRDDLAHERALEAILVKHGDQFALHKPLVVKHRVQLARLAARRGARRASLRHVVAAFSASPSLVVARLLGSTRGDRSGGLGST